MLSREIKLLAQLVGASAGFSWNKESAAAIHDTLMLMAVSAERLEAEPKAKPPLEVATTASLLELAQQVIRSNGLTVTTEQARALAAGLITLSAEKQVNA